MYNLHLHVPNTTICFQYVFPDFSNYGCANQKLDKFW